MDKSSYISGFVDGEGCFCVSFTPSVRHKFGWEVRPSFSVSQNADRAQLLELLLEHWQCGTIRPDRSDQTVKYEVRSINHLMDRVLPHFQSYPLLSSKQEDVEHFQQICALIRSKQHLQLEGLTQIVKLAMGMNPSGKRRYSESEILNSLVIR